MKECKYCGREISYHQMYCDDICAKPAEDFFQFRNRFTKVFSILNVICVFSIPIGIFLFPIIGLPGIYLALSGTGLIGFVLIIFPFPTEGMISKFKIKKAIGLSRGIGAGLIILSAVSLAIVLFLAI